MGRDALKTVDWTLPGMEKFSQADLDFFEREIVADDPHIVNAMASLGWAYWPVSNKGFLDERLLRKIADFIEIQNKPFWDSYEEYCRKEAEQGPPDHSIEDDFVCPEVAHGS